MIPRLTAHGRSPARRSGCALPVPLPGHLLHRIDHLRGPILLRLPLPPQVLAPVSHLCPVRWSRQVYPLPEPPLHRSPHRRAPVARLRGLPVRGAYGSRRQSATSRPVAQKSSPATPDHKGSQLPPAGPTARVARGSEPASHSGSVWRAAHWRQ